MSLKDLEKCSIADGFKPPTAQMNGKRYAPKNFMFRISFGGSKKSYPLIKNVFQDGASKETAATTVLKENRASTASAEMPVHSLFFYSLKKKAVFKISTPCPCSRLFRQSLSFPRYRWYGSVFQILYRKSSGRRETGISSKILLATDNSFSASLLS